jgi:hypothetical protein
MRHSLPSNGSETPSLPLFAFVELGKHAMALDINRDGVFTFGRDINNLREHAHIWAIRAGAACSPIGVVMAGSSST